MSQPIIEVSHISKRYRLGALGAGSLKQEIENWWRRRRGKSEKPETAKDFWALNDVSFDVQPGEVLGIIGRNGAGKSTLLKILSRITAPTTGGAIMRGRVASLLEVGTGFHPDLSGRDNVYLNGAILGMKSAEIDDKFDEIVGFAEVEKFIDAPVKHYSSGMYVRLAFAVAANLSAEILLVDEVLAVGDILFQQKCLGKLRDTSQSGKTILFISHNLGAIQSLCSKCHYLSQGRIEYSGTAQETVNYYLNQSGHVSRSVSFAPNHAPAQLESATLLPGTGSSTEAGVYRHEDSIRLLLKMVVRKPGPHLSLDIDVFKDFDSFIFFSSNKVCEQASDFNEPGRYEIEVTIPPRTLAHGLFSFTLSLVDLPNTVIERHWHCVDFRVVDSGPKRAMYLHESVGAVLIEPLWKITTL